MSKYRDGSSQMFFFKIHWEIPVLETPKQMFSYENCEIFKNSFFYRTRTVAASVNIFKNLLDTYFSQRFCLDKLLNQFQANAPLLLPLKT